MSNKPAPGQVDGSPPTARQTDYEQFETYLNFEIEYHQKRYLEGENRAARLAGFCGTLATLLSSGALALASRDTPALSIPPYAYIPFIACVCLLFAAAGVSLLGILPTDKYGKLTRPVTVWGWVKNIARTSVEMQAAKNEYEVRKLVEQNALWITWTEQHRNEPLRGLVMRSKIVSLLAFKRSIGVRQMTATFAIVFIICSMLLMLATVISLLI